MDYEDQTRTRNVSITVENEETLFYCSVKTRKALGLWEVDTKVQDSLKQYPVIITAEDVNDPPEFIPPVQVFKIMENTKIGTPVGTLTVKDPDKTHGNAFQEVKLPLNTMFNCFFIL